MLQYVNINTVLIWRHDDVPVDVLQYLGGSIGSDVAWVAFVPSMLDGTYIPWLQSTSWSTHGIEKFQSGYGFFYLGRNPL